MKMQQPSNHITGFINSVKKYDMKLHIFSMLIQLYIISIVGGIPLLKSGLLEKCYPDPVPFYKII